MLNVDHAFVLGDDDMDKDTQFGDVIFTFGPFVPLVDLPLLVQRAPNTDIKSVAMPESDAALDNVVWNDLDTKQPNDDAGAFQVTAIPGTPLSTNTVSKFRRYVEEQTLLLKLLYEQNEKPGYAERVHLADKANMTLVQVTTWFNNRRKREIVFRRSCSAVSPEPAPSRRLITTVPGRARAHLMRGGAFTSSSI